MEPVQVVIAFRLIVPLLILRWPLFGFLVALLADWADGELAAVLGGSFNGNYHTIDKLLDLHMAAFALIAAARFGKIAFHTSRALFALRVVGVALFEATGARFLLVLFPNVFEFFFLFYSARNRFFRHFELTARNLPYVLAALAIPKLAQELALHVLGVDLWIWGIQERIREWLTVR